MSWKKVIAIEFGDRSQRYVYRLSLRVDLRVCLAVLTCLVILFLSLSLRNYNPKEASPCLHRDFLKDPNDALHSAYLFMPNFRPPPPPPPPSETNIGEIPERMEFIKNMTLEAWHHHDGKTARHIKGLDTVQMLSTLWVMGLQNEYEQSKKWIESNFYNNDYDYPVYTFVAATEYMGSLLSCYALTKDSSMLSKAKEIGNKLKVEFNTATGLPRKHLSNLGSDSSVHLAEAGGQHLEFGYLSALTDDSDMNLKLKNARKFLETKNKQNGLYMSDLNVNTGNWASSTSSLFWPANVFHQYLVKSYVQSNGKDGQSIRMYKEAIDAVVDKSLITKSKGGLTYARNYNPTSRQYSSYMEYEGCYLGAMLALGADAMQRDFDNRKGLIDAETKKQKQNRIEQHWAMAKAIVETCHTASNKTKTKLPPKAFNFGKGNEASKYQSEFSFTAGLAESYFVLWRLTHEVKYRDYAWEMAQAIYRHCRTSSGKYYEIDDVDSEYVNNYGEHPSHFVSTTLKYLYLTFADGSLLPLDEWVFNRVGQPLPICGKNSAYGTANCYR